MNVAVANIVTEYMLSHFWLCTTFLHNYLHLVLGELCFVVVLRVVVLVDIVPDYVSKA